VAGGSPLAKRPFRSLAFRMGVALCLGAALILLGAGAWNLHLQRAHLTRLVGVSAERVADTIRGSTRDGMLRNDAEQVHRMIASIGEQPGIARIRIFNKEGTIRTSTDAAEVGRQVDKSAEQCYACHQRGRPLDRLDRQDRVRIFRAASGQSVLGIIAPIHNEPQCTAACHAHPASQRVLGVLDVQLSMETVDEALVASERQMLGGLAATVGAMVALVGALVWALVVKPVSGLRLAMSRVSQGDLESRVPVTSRDEIGAMAASWNAMTEELARSRSELQEWNRTLEQRVAEKTAELTRAHDRMLLSQKMASLGKLAAMVAHEINNPLAGVRTYVRLLRRQAESGAVPATEAERVLEIVDSEVGRCGEIVRNLLTFSRSGAAHFAEQDLVPLLGRCELLLRHQAEMAGVALRVDAEPNLPRVECDAAQIQQMVLALAINALEAMPAGGAATFAARRHGEGVVVEVSDTGGGIPEADREHVFEPFFTTKEAGKGVGLGLAVVYGIVNRHHGRVELRSAVGKGTTFSVFLPLSQPAPGPEGEEDAS
jgi:two-component system NtrC family sensor kinase